MPVGLQTFRELVEEKYLYVDKTEEIYRLVNHDVKYCLLTRPRRFGKSLLVSTLGELFAGNKELFEGLWIYDKIEWNEYPVIGIDFTKVSYKTPELFEESLRRYIEDLARGFGESLDREKDYKEAFLELIGKLSTRGRVVILVDEYDKPIIDHVENQEIARRNRDILREFYSVIKAADKQIKFAFLTGVSKFSRVSVFSGLNNLDDITLDKNFATMLGYTEKEMTGYFAARLDSLGTLLKMPKEDFLEKIKTWYDGYSWDGEQFVYNPLSILQLFLKGEFNNYWFSTATPTFLVKTIKEKGILPGRLEDIDVDNSVFDSCDVDHIDLAALLFQTGYLTVKRKTVTEDGNLYRLSYPNKEVKESFFKHLLKGFTANDISENNRRLNSLRQAIESHNIEEFVGIMKAIFAGIPYNIAVRDREGYYHSIIYLVLTMLGARVSAEVETNRGRVDCVLETREKIFIVEFKMGSADEALAQIHQKKYYEPYQHQNKEIILIGVSFDMESRNIDSYQMEALPVSN